MKETTIKLTKKNKNIISDIWAYLSQLEHYYAKNNTDKIFCHDICMKRQWLLDNFKDALVDEYNTFEDLQNGLTEDLNMHVAHGRIYKHE